jgi:hypothetical protein
VSDRWERPPLTVADMCYPRRQLYCPKVLGTAYKRPSLQLGTTITQMASPLHATQFETIAAHSSVKMDVRACEQWGRAAFECHGMREAKDGQWSRCARGAVAEVVIIGRAAGWLYRAFDRFTAYAAGTGTSTTTFLLTTWI